MDRSTAYYDALYETQRACHRGSVLVTGQANNKGSVHLGLK